MKLPDNIKKLLSSHVHENRAIGIALLESLGDVKRYFESTSVSYYMKLILSYKNEIPVTIVISEDNVYWINTGSAWLWIGDKKECDWPGTDHRIIKI